MRLAIRRATLPLFAERGYDDTSIDDIVAAAEISRRTFFRHFEGKHQILSADHEVHLAAVADHLSRHENERTISRAGHALALLLDAFAAAPDEARTRLRVLSATTV